MHASSPSDDDINYCLVVLESIKLQELAQKKQEDRERGGDEKRYGNRTESAAAVRRLSIATQQKLPIILQYNNKADIDSAVQ